MLSETAETAHFWVPKVIVYTADGTAYKMPPAALRARSGCPGAVCGRFLSPKWSEPSPGSLKPRMTSFGRSATLLPLDSLPIYDPPISDFSPIEIWAGREPLWYVLKYVSGKERVLTWLLDYIKLPYQHLVYKQRVKRFKDPVERCWLPGYMFLHCDIRRDNWGQVLRIPYALEVLGDPSPLPPGLVDDLVLRLPVRPTKPTAFSCIAPGTRVKFKRGAFADHVGLVTWSERRKLKVLLMIFNRPEEIMSDVSDVEIV